MAKQKKIREKRCPECGNVHDGMCRDDSYSIPMDDPRRSVVVGPDRKRLMGFGNKRS